MTHPSGEFATERLRDRMVITAKGLSRTSPSLFVEVMCFFIFSVSVMSGLPPGSGNPFDLPGFRIRSEEHTPELQSRLHLACRLLLEKKNRSLIRAPPYRI